MKPKINFIEFCFFFNRIRTKSQFITLTMIGYSFGAITRNNKEFFFGLTICCCLIFVNFVPKKKFCNLEGVDEIQNISLFQYQIVLSPGVRV